MPVLVAVTGASGFIGGRVADVLAAHGHEVMGFGRQPLGDVARRGWIGYRSWDVTSGPLADEWMPDAVVHCAGRVSDWGSSSLFERTNVDGTRAVLASFPHSRRFVYISTASVYDPRRPKRFISEDAPLPSRYLNAYSSSKRRAESLLGDARPDAVVLRPHAVYGPGDPTLLPRLLAARRRGHLLACGSGRNRVSLTHVDNLVHAIELAIASEARGIFNIADAETPTLREILATVNRVLGGRGAVFIPKLVARGAAVVYEGIARLRRTSEAPMLTRYIVAQLTSEYTLDIDRARRILGYRPFRGYPAAIEEAINGRC